jgi:hypothetical protein
MRFRALGAKPARSALAALDGDGAVRMPTRPLQHAARVANRFVALRSLRTDLGIVAAVAAARLVMLASHQIDHGN